VSANRNFNYKRAQREERSMCKDREKRELWKLVGRVKKKRVEAKVKGDFTTLLTSIFVLSISGN
jgi:hypothetical protein